MKSGGNREGEQQSGAGDLQMKMGKGIVGERKEFAYLVFCRSTGTLEYGFPDSM